MPKELTLLEEFDIVAELQFPDFIYATDSMEEKIAFSKMINDLSNRRIMLIDDILFSFSFITAGLNESHIETLTRGSDYNCKKALFENFGRPYFVKEVEEIIAELDRRQKTTENSARLKNILQYLKDNRFIV